MVRERQGALIHNDNHLRPGPPAWIYVAVFALLLGAVALAAWREWRIWFR